MSHELEIDEQGVASFVSNRETPWHKLGTIVDGAMTIDEVLEKARLDWTVELEPVFLEDGVQVDDHFATVRVSPLTGEREALGMVGNRYEPLQTRAACSFMDFMDDSLYETAGSIFGGRKVFVSKILSRDIVLDASGAADNLDIYLMAYNSFDGKSAFTLATTIIRPVCYNTVQFALRKAQSTWSTRHTINVEQRKAVARQVLGISYKYVDAFEAEAQAMIQTQITNDRFEAIIADLWPVSEDAKETVKNRVEDQRDVVRHLFAEADTNANARGTAWGAYNAVTEYLDWYKKINGVEGDLLCDKAYERRFADTAVVGATSKLKQRAYELVTA